MSCSSCRHYRPVAELHSGGSCALSRRMTSARAGCDQYAAAEYESVEAFLARGGVVREVSIADVDIKEATRGRHWREGRRRKGRRRVCDDVTREAAE